MHEPVQHQGRSRSDSLQRMLELEKKMMVRTNLSVLLEFQRYLLLATVPANSELDQQFVSIIIRRLRRPQPNHSSAASSL